MATQKTQNKYNVFGLKRAGLWVGTLLLVVDSIAMIATGEVPFVIAASMFVGLWSISTNLWPYIGMIQPSKDERAARIGALAGLASWYISLFVTVVAAVVLGYLPAFLDIHPTLAHGLGVVILATVIPMLVLYEYLIRKSKLE